MKAKTANSTKYAVLSMLSLKPMSGYDIKQFAAGSIGHFWKESYGQIYPTLRLLQKEGLAIPEEEKNNGERLRRVFRITTKGKTEVENWLKDQPRPEPARSELLLKLFFGYQVSPQESVRHIEAFRQTMQAQLQEYQQIEKQLEKNLSHHPGFPYWIMTLQFGKYRALAYLQWCDVSLDLLSKNNPKDSKLENATKNSNQQQSTKQEG
ncbi:MAG TPA: PadR family transcriptional regulator [Terriglobales bacterium]|jgi:PadR family transcriptional regulator AphA|nr:PadR family transcriptional regulator [Terriglobales bacterium]